MTLKEFRALPKEEIERIANETAQRLSDSVDLEDLVTFFVDENASFYSKNLDFLFKDAKTFNVID